MRSPLLFILSVSSNIRSYSSREYISTYLGLSRQTLSKYLKGKGTFDTVQLVKLTHYFRVPIEQFLTGIDDAEAKICYRYTDRNRSYCSNIDKQLRTYIKKYNQTAQAVDYYSTYIPEQYDLFASIRGERLNVNRELGRAINQEEKLDEIIEKDILAIADEQRANLSLMQEGAITLIPALEKKGIRVVFLDFGSSDISGASVCAESCGCFIFVNSNADVTIERQLFTVAHEYGHILLHRPQYYSEYEEINNEFYEAYLNRMANKFAARLVSPPSLYYQYALELKQSANDLEKIIPLAVRIKLRVQLSLQSVMLSLRDNKLISSEVVDNYFNYLEASNTRSIEPFPISEDIEVKNAFLQKRNAKVKELLESAYLRKKIGLEDIALLDDVSIEAAEEIALAVEAKYNKMCGLIKAD